MLQFESKVYDSVPKKHTVTMSAKYYLLVKKHFNKSALLHFLLNPGFLQTPLLLLLQLVQKKKKKQNIHGIQTNTKEQRAGKREGTRLRLLMEILRSGNWQCHFQLRF